MVDPVQRLFCRGQISPSVVKNLNKISVVLCIGLDIKTSILRSFIRLCLQVCDTSDEAYPEGTCARYLHQIAGGGEGET